MSQLLAVGLLLIVVVLLATHFKDIKNSGNSND